MSVALGTSEPRPRVGLGPVSRLVAMPSSPDAVPIDPQAFCALLGRAAWEVSLGVRSHVQLARWVSEEVFLQLGRLAGYASAQRGRGAVKLRAVRAQRIGQELEGVAVIDDGVRVRFVAVAARWQRGRWLATAIELG